MTQIEEAIKIYHAGVERVMPVNLVRNSVTLNGTFIILSLCFLRPGRF